MNASESALQRRRFFVSPGDAALPHRNWRVVSLRADAYAEDFEAAASIAHAHAEEHWRQTGEPTAVLAQDRTGRWTTRAEFGE